LRHKAAGIGQAFGNNSETAVDSGPDRQSESEGGKVSNLKLEVEKARVNLFL